MKFETEKWPYVPARWQTRVQGRREVNRIVIHVMEGQEKGNTAENVGLYFKNHPGYLIYNGRKINSRPSAHVGVDADSVVQYVLDNNVAHAAPGVNHDGIHVELAGVSAQTAAQWSDPYSTLMLDRAADVVAQYCLKYDVPPVRLTLKELRARKKGIIGHVDATNTFKPNSGHTDPGIAFPWKFFIERVAHYCDLRRRKAASQPNT